jgi:hypothetical protein
MMINQHTRPQHSTTALNHSTQPQHPTTTSNHNIKPQHLTSTPNQHPPNTQPPHSTNTQPQHPITNPTTPPVHIAPPGARARVRRLRHRRCAAGPRDAGRRVGRRAGRRAGWRRRLSLGTRPRVAAAGGTLSRGAARNTRRCRVRVLLSCRCIVLCCVVSRCYLHCVALCGVVWCVVGCGVVCCSVLCCLTPRASPRRRGREMDAALDSLQHESSSALKQPSEALKQRLATPPDGHDDHATQHAQHARVQQGAATPVRGPSAAYNWDSSGRAVEK